MKEDAGRGWRRVVAFPKPVEIVELTAIKALVDSGIMVIIVGGGGIPVIRKADGSLEGIAAVIDKDFASERLAEDVNADALLILMSVGKAILNYGKPNQKELDTITVQEAKKYIREGHFAAGSLLPKINATMTFADSREGRIAIISSLERNSRRLLAEPEP